MTVRKKRPASSQRPLYVRWIDAHAVVDAWTDIANVDDLEPRLIETCGFLLPGLKAKHLCIAQSLDHENDAVDNVLAIPTGMVQQVIDLVHGNELAVTELA